MCFFFLPIYFRDPILDKNRQIFMAIKTRAFRKTPSRGKISSENSTSLFVCVRENQSFGLVPV